MAAPQVFPDFDDAWIVHASDDLLVVDKPAGVPTQAPSPEEPEDLVTRLRRHLAARGPEPYLGVHQRLDRDTSGLVLFTTRKDANAAIAAAFEGRGIEKGYTALVEGRIGKRILRDALDKGDDGLQRVVAPTRGKPAVTHVDEKRRPEGQGSRVELALRLETGRTHQARVQLAHARVPIAGDRLYGGPRAPRLMLHASRLELREGPFAPLRFTSAPPPAFDRWLRHGDLGKRVYDDAQALAETLFCAKEARFSLGVSADTSCFRLVNEEGDALPHLAIDVYGEHAVVQLYDDGEGLWEERSRVDRVLDAVAALGFSGVYLKNRPRQANTLVDTRKDELAPKLPSRGVPAADPLLVHEDGVPFSVRLGDGLSTGVFLDQRKNRRLCRLSSGGLRVLNLFAYTCGFSVAAAMGGASATVSVDASHVALERGRENLMHAGFTDSSVHKTVAEDAFAYLALAAKKGETFDLVVLDPPSYSTSKKRRFVAEQHYGELAQSALAVLSPGGRLLASTNHRGISKSKLRRLLFGAAEALSLGVAQIKDLPSGSDFPPEPGQDPNMKAVLLTLARPGEARKVRQDPAPEPRPRTANVPQKKPFSRSSGGPPKKFGAPPKKAR